MSDHLTEFCRQRYDYEASRRGELTGAIALPLGVLSVLGGALVAALKDLRSPLQAPDVVLLSAAGLSLVACVVSGVYLARSYFGYTYRYVATPKVVRDHHTKVKEAYTAVGRTETEAQDSADKAVVAYIQERYAESAHHNTLNNDRKSSLLHRANGAMIVALVPAVIAAGAFLRSSFYSAPSTTRVELVNIKEALPKENCNGYRASQGPACPVASAPTGPNPAGAASGPLHQGASGPNKAASR